jgi:hypothetical protein
LTSSDPSVVEILNATTGDARFASVGTARVTVTFEQPEVIGSEKMMAFMDVRVTMYEVELFLTSAITGEPVDSARALLSDSILVNAIVTKDGTPVTSSGVQITLSSDTSVAKLTPAVAPDRAVLRGVGTATLHVIVDQPDIPGESASLADSIHVNVETFVASVSVASNASTHLANGDTLVTDSVTFSAQVMDISGTVPSSGAKWTSSDSNVVRFTDDTAGVAVLDGVGSATVSVTFEEPALPADTVEGAMDVGVTTYVTQIDVESNITAAPYTDTLVTDQVTFSASVTKDAQSVASAVSGWTSETPSVVTITNASTGEATFADTGQARVAVNLSSPTLPRATLTDTLDLRITTYIAQISGPGSTPTMGDTVQYTASITDTRAGTLLSTFGVTFTTTDNSVISYFDASSGLALARDTGTAIVGVTLDSPSLPNGAVADSLSPTTMTDEFFYGAFSTATGDFGDTVIVYADDVHFFTDSTRITFPNGTVLFADTNWTDSLRTLVGAGTTTDTLTVTNLADDGGGFRTDVPTRFQFAGQGGVADAFEPNDTFPLTTADSIGVPFEALLSIDPAKLDPIDNNFFYFFIETNMTVEVTADWQQVANIDFYVCQGVGNPPTGVLAICQMQANDPSTRGPETASAAFGAGGPFVLRVWCEGSCPSVPLTYKLTVKEP